MTSVVPVAPLTPPAAPPSSASLADTLRALRPVLVGLDTAPFADGVPLERQVMRADTPVVAACTPIEDGGVRSVASATVPLVAAFLDGIQRSRAVAYVNGTPLIFATVAAAVRQRTNGRLDTWGMPQVQRLLLASQDALGRDRWQQLQEARVTLVDVSSADLPDHSGHDPVWHPHALRARALDCVALEREQLERRLAAQWCATESRWLWIDGGIAGNLAVAAAAPAFGVVKSHTTLYGDAVAVRQVLALKEGQRSPAFLAGHHPRRAVASWYLRLRSASHGDPLFGLVRVEIAPPSWIANEPPTRADHDAFSDACDQLSSAILLERHPVSLPDARWDTLAYGVHAVETYLQALVGP